VKHLLRGGGNARRGKKRHGKARECKRQKRLQNAGHLGTGMAEQTGRKRLGAVEKKDYG